MGSTLPGAVTFIIKKTNPITATEVPSVLNRIDYLITDCKRDFKIAIENGFKGSFLGIFPGGGGFKTMDVDLNKKLDFFLVKGYENELGKAVNVIKALNNIAKKREVTVKVFGACNTFKELIKNIELCESLKIDVYDHISHYKVLKMMKEATFYVGNSLSDGMPNTMLEAIKLWLYSYSVKSWRGNC